MDPLAAARLVLYGTLGGSLLGFLGGVLVAWLNTRAETRRQILRLGYEAGIKEWEFHVEVRKHNANLSRGPTALIEPPLPFVQFHAKTMTLLLDGKLTPETYRQVQAEVSRP